MIHYGDITKISGYDVPVVDCVVGGSPCQNFSVAGNREGLEGDQSVLFVEQLRVIKEMREKDAKTGRTAEFLRPRFMVWENVPGALSSNKCQDFRKVLEETAKIVDKDATIPMPPKNKWTTSGCIMGDGWSIAWRICDAQFWGVPQRRRRIALVADFGGGCAPEILFVRNGLQGDTEKSREKRQGTSADVEGCTGVCDTERVTVSYDIGDRRRVPNEYKDVSPTLTCTHGGEPVICMATQQGGAEIKEDGKAPTLTAAAGMSGNNQPVICLQANGVDRADTAGCNGKGWKEGASYTLTAMDRHCVVYNGSQITSEVNKSNLLPGDPCHTLTVDNRNYVVEAKPHYIVRRLTPMECERLQGFPDGWTDIGEYTDSKGKRKKSSDSARYKALGNSIALPSWKWLIKRLCSHYERDVTLASLFDGIGGFPFLWEQINGRGSCIWASEIDDFPMAVTKKRIGES